MMVQKHWCSWVRLVNNQNVPTIVWWVQGSVSALKIQSNCWTEATQLMCTNKCVTEGAANLNYWFSPWWFSVYCIIWDFFLAGSLSDLEVGKHHRTSRNSWRDFINISRHMIIHKCYFASSLFTRDLWSGKRFSWHCCASRFVQGLSFWSIIFQFFCSTCIDDFVCCRGTLLLSASPLCSRLFCRTHRFSWSWTTIGFDACDFDAEIFLFACVAAVLPATEAVPHRLGGYLVLWFRGVKSLEFLTYLNLWELWSLCKKIKYFWSQCQVLPVFVDLVCMALAESGTPSLACGYLRKHKMLWIWMLQAANWDGLRCCFPLWYSVCTGASMHLGDSDSCIIQYEIALRLEIGVASIHLPHYCFPKLYKIVKQCAVTGIWS